MKYYPDDFKKCSIEDIGKELAREQRMRAKVYPAQIQAGKLNEHVARSRYRQLRVLLYIMYLCKARKISLADLLEKIGGPGDPGGEQKEMFNI